MIRDLKPGLPSQINLDGTAFVIGQDQDAIFGGFQSHQSFKGSLTCYNVWDKVLSPYEVEQLAADCRSDQGSVFAWDDLKSHIKGEIQLESLPLTGLAPI